MQPYQNQPQYVQVQDQGQYYLQQQQPQQFQQYQNQPPQQQYQQIQTQQVQYPGQLPQQQQQLYSNVTPQQQVFQSIPQTTAATLVPTIDLESFRAKYEIKASHIPVLQNLIRYRAILICDDSGSMNELADNDTNSPITRWAELQKMVKIIIEGHAAVGSYCDIYFINRPGVLHVTDWNQCAHLFAPPPSGSTNTCRVLQQIQQHEVGTDMGKPIIIHLLTDGHPTDDAGRENHTQLENMIINRKFQTKTFFSVVLCTDDEEVDKMYRRLESTAGVDLSMNYRGERKEILEIRGSRYPFSFGDYATKVMVGSFDKTLHDIDKPQLLSCACIIS